MKEKFLIQLAYYLYQMVLLVIFFITFTCCKNTTLANEYYQKSLKEYSVCNYEKAYEFIEQSLQYDNNNEQANFLKAKIYFFQKNYNNAKKIFNTLCFKYKNNIDYKFWLCRTYFFNNDLEALSVTLSEIEKLNKDDWRVYYWKALLNKKENNFEQYFYNLSISENCIKNSDKVFTELAFIWHELGLEDKSNFYIAKSQAVSGDYLNSKTSTTSDTHTNSTATTSQLDITQEKK